MENQQDEKREEKDTILLPTGRISPDDLTVGSPGSGGAPNDTGGLDGAGNELGAVGAETGSGRSEGKREDDADAGARKP
jgi:hypothetical protein